MRRTTVAWVLFFFALVLFAVYAQTLIPAIVVIGIGLLIAAIFIGLGESVTW